MIGNISEALLGDYEVVTMIVVYLRREAQLASWDKVDVRIGK